MGELLAWGHRGQQDRTVPYTSASLVLGCFATGRRGASLWAAIPGTAPHKPCLELLTLPVTSAVVSAGLISATAIRRPYTGSEIGTSLGRRHKGRGTELLLERNSLPRWAAQQSDPLLLCRTHPCPFRSRSRGQEPELSCAPAWAWHVPAPVLPVLAHGWGRQLCVSAPLQRGCSSGRTKGRCCSILLLLLPILSISQPAANSLPQPLGPWQGCGSSEPAPSPGFLCSRRDGRGDFPSSVARPPLFSRFPTWPCASAPTLSPSLQPPGRPACTSSALPCPALPEGFYPGAVLAAGPWEGRGGLGKQGSAFQRWQWGIRHLSTIIKYCLHCLLTER